MSAAQTVHVHDPPNPGLQQDRDHSCLCASECRLCKTILFPLSLLPAFHPFPTGELFKKKIETQIKEGTEHNTDYQMVTDLLCDSTSLVG